jgi:hypothetical protein
LESVVRGAEQAGPLLSKFCLQVASAGNFTVYDICLNLMFGDNGADYIDKEDGKPTLATMVLRF